MPRIASFTSQSLVNIGRSIRALNLPEYVSFVLDRSEYIEEDLVGFEDVITATITTRNVEQGVTVGYTVTGLSSNDLEEGSALTGTITINSKGQGVLQLSIRADGLTEGDDSFTITLAATDSVGNSTGSLSASATILDTSNDPNATPWLDDNDNIVTVRSIISPVAMQLNGSFAVNPTVPITIEGRITGTTTTITNISANTGTVLEVDDTGNSTNFVIGEQLNLIVPPLLVNGNFSNGLTGWSTSEPSAVSVVNEEAVINAAGNGDISQQVALAAGSYTVSFDVISTTDSPYFSVFIVSPFQVLVSQENLGGLEGTRPSFNFTLNDPRTIEIAIFMTGASITVDNFVLEAA